MVKWLFPRRFLLSIAGLALAAAATSASAQEQGYSEFEITPFYGYMAGGEFENPSTNTDRDLDEGNNFGVIFNAAVDQWRHYELIYSTQSTEIDGPLPIDLDVQYLQIGGTVSNPDATRLIPYFGITFGAARFSPDQSGLDDETKLAFTVGAGFKVPVTEHIGVRFDARAFISLLDTDGNIFCVSDNGVGTCAIRTKSDTFLQYHAALGVVVGF
ncbi:MAG: outer membrane beta-barrel protein [Steroidobacter sp.]